MDDLSALFWPMAGFFVALIAAGIGFPIPEELPTIGAGIWVASNPDLGELRDLRWLALPVCCTGVICSDVLLYTIGRFWGPRLLEHRWLKRLVPPEKRAKIESNFAEYGVKVLLMIRWLPAIRSPMFVTAGIMRVPLIRFVLADGIAAVVGHSLLFFLAYWFGDQFKDLVMRIEHELDVAKPILILAALAVVAAFLIYHFVKKPVMTGDPAELPILGEKVASKIIHPEPPCAKEPPGTSEKS